MMIDLVSPDFFDLSYLWCHTGAYPISFGGSWILTDLHDHHLLDAHWDVDMIVTLRSPWDPPSQVRTSWHLDVIMPLHLGGTSWICVHDSVMDSDDHCYMFDDRWFHVARFLTCRASNAHTGAYFPFRMRFMDFHGGHMCDDGWFHDICSSDLSRTWCHTGAYSFPEDLYGSS